MQPVPYVCISLTDLVLWFPAEVPRAADLPQLLHAARPRRREAPLPLLLHHDGARGRPLLPVVRLSPPMFILIADMLAFKMFKIAKNLA